MTVKRKATCWSNQQKAKASDWNYQLATNSDNRLEEKNIVTQPKNNRIHFCKIRTRVEKYHQQTPSDEAEQLPNPLYTFLAILRMRLRDWVDNVSNCTVGLFWGTNFAHSFLRNFEIANNGSDSDPKTIPWCRYFRDTKQTQSHAELQKS